MKFYIKTQGSHVWIQIGDSDNKWVQLSVDIRSDFAATAVCERIERAMCDTVTSIRANAYAAGWADAKGKRTKKKHFAGCINGDPKHVGY